MRPSAQISHEDTRRSRSCALNPRSRTDAQAEKEHAGQEGAPSPVQRAAGLRFGRRSLDWCRLGAPVMLRYMQLGSGLQARLGRQKSLFSGSTPGLYTRREGERAGGRRRSCSPLLLLCCYWSSHLIAVQRSMHPPPPLVRWDTHVLGVRCVPWSLQCRLHPSEGGGRRVPCTAR